MNETAFFFRLHAQTKVWASPTFRRHKNFLDEIGRKCPKSAIFHPHPPSIFYLLSGFYKGEKEYDKKRCEKTILALNGCDKPFAISATYAVLRVLAIGLFQIYDYLITM